MATWPESDPYPNYPLIVTPRWRTQIQSFEGGGEQRRKKSLYPMFDVEVTYKVLSRADTETLYNFFMARCGSYEAFYIYDLTLINSESWAHDALYVGTGDGSTEVFDIPGKSTSSQKIYVDGVEQTLTTDYVILTGGGTSSSDRVDFVSAPASGEVITCDFTGYARFRVRFAEDTLARESFLYQLHRYKSIKLTGLEAA